MFPCKSCSLLIRSEVCGVSAAASVMTTTRFLGAVDIGAMCLPVSSKYASLRLESESKGKTRPPPEACMATAGV